jgi:hypothetical protein
VAVSPDQLLTPGTPEPLNEGYYLPSWQESARLAIANSVEFVPDPVDLADTHDRYIGAIAGEATGPEYLNSDLGQTVLESIHMARSGMYQRHPGLMVHSMYRMAETAHSAGLDHLKYGLYAYCRVTGETIDHTAIPGFFDHPEKIRATMPYFFGELLKALHFHVSGRPDAVDGWRDQFYSKEAQRAPPAVAMLDFLTAHVRYDLGMALLRTGTGDEHHSDYRDKMNIILTKVANEIVDKYADYPTPVKLLGINRLGLRLALHELFQARDEAWNNFEAMQLIQDSAFFAQARQDQARRTRRRTVSGKKGARLIFKVMTRLPDGKWDGDDALDPSARRNRGHRSAVDPMAGIDLSSMALREIP